MRKEIARLAQYVHGAPRKEVSKGIRIDEIYIVKPLSVKEISNKLDINWNAVDKLKKSGEDFLTGYFSALKSMSGIELEIIKDKII